MKARLAVTGFLLALSFVGSVHAASLAIDRSEPLTPLPATRIRDPLKIELGRALFSDPLLSASQKVSCNSCHDLSMGGTVRLPRAIGTDGRRLMNVPTIFNVANNYRLGWRGNLRSLPEQNEAMLLGGSLMATNWNLLVARLGSSRLYNAKFGAAYGEAPTKENILDALVSYEGSLQTPGAPFDRYLEGDPGALSALQIKGYALFKDYGCASCHQGSNIGGNMIEKVGIFRPADQGPKGTPQPDATEWGAGDAQAEGRIFRVPSLRNVAVTGPYFHDGRVPDLPTAVSTMGRLQLGRELSPQDIAAMTAFLESLTGSYEGKNLSAASKGIRQ